MTTPVAPTFLHTMTIAGMYRHDDLVILFGDTPLGRAALQMALMHPADATAYAAGRTVQGYRDDPVGYNRAVGNPSGRVSDNMVVAPVARVTVPQAMPADIPIVCTEPAPITVELDGDDPDDIDLDPEI